VDGVEGGVGGDGGETNSGGGTVQLLPLIDKEKTNPPMPTTFELRLRASRFGRSPTISITLPRQREIFYQSLHQMVPASNVSLFGSLLTVVGASVTNKTTSKIHPQETIHFRHKQTRFPVSFLEKGQAEDQT